MQLIFRQPANVGERFAADAFAGIIGTTAPLLIGDKIVADCTVKDVEIVEGGMVSVWTVELADETTDARSLVDDGRS